MAFAPLLERQRTRLLLHLVEIQPLDGTDPVEQVRAIERELELAAARTAQALRHRRRESWRPAR